MCIPLRSCVCVRACGQLFVFHRFEKERDGLVRMYEGRLLTESTVAEATITRLRSNVDDIDAANARAVATLKANFDQQVFANRL